MDDSLLLELQTDAMNEAMQLQKLNLADPDVKRKKFPLVMAVLILNAKKYTIARMHPQIRLHRLLIFTSIASIESNCKEFQQVEPEVLESAQILKSIESTCEYYQEAEAELLASSQIG